MSRYYPAGVIFHNMILGLPWSRVKLGSHQVLYAINHIAFNSFEDETQDHQT